MKDIKMLQAILNNQSLIRKDIEVVKKEVKKNGVRIDKLGIQLAELEDDAPTYGEFELIDKRVAKLEKKFSHKL